MPETSILLRTKDEEKWVDECLKRIFSQTYRNFEVLILDSGSRDRTLEIARRYPIQIFSLLPAEFTYPKALNVLAGKAAASKYFCILSAHSLPSSRTWLADGVSHFADKRVCGVYGPVWALPDASIWEKVLFNRYLNWLRHWFRRNKIITEPGMGVLGNTNALIRRDLWERHHFDEAHAAGGEDGEWAAYWLSCGFIIIRDLKFAVYHSHGLGFADLWRQFGYWEKMMQPHDKLFPGYGRKRKQQ